MDFFRVCTKSVKKDGIATFEVFPDFVIGRSKDLMVRGRAFYAIWDPDLGLWSTDEYDVQRLVDAELKREAAKLEGPVSIKYLSSYGSNSWIQFRSYVGNISDNSHTLDENLTFANQDVKKGDYVSRRLPYPLSAGDTSAWDELIGNLYNVEERTKIEWSIGAVVSGDAKKIQKFMVLYGPAGTGKSTVLNIIQKLFEGYTASFEAKALGSNNNQFATEAFKSNPLVAIQHDGDLSRIEDNTKLNSIVSHEDMQMNEKYKPSYTARVNAFLFMGTNQPVKISDAKSGIIRRLIDVHPTGVKLPPNHYNTLMSQIDFELGAIAHHCLEIYRTLGKNYYNAYRPLEMMLQTDVFYNFIEAHYDVFKTQDGVTLSQAYGLYREYCANTGIEKVMPQYKLREELRNYFEKFQERAVLDGLHVRSYYSGFKIQPFKQPAKDDVTFSLVIDETESLLDELFADQPAQLATESGIPAKKWESVKTTLSEIDTQEVHYVRPPERHIVIDFDLRGDDGEKSLERNLEAASSWPATYAELSKSGGGVHLHYNYDGAGSVAELNPLFSDGIEVKTFTGNSSLRRRLSRCNRVPVAAISSGLPHREKKLLTNTTLSSEKGLRDLIKRNLRKEVHPGTKPSIDFIKKILDDAYESGMSYDVTDMRSTIVAFASNSSNRAMECLKIVQKMQFASERVEAEAVETFTDDRLVFFDVEVYPNLFVICWKFQGDDRVIRMINPSAHEVAALFKLKLIGFNNRRYDNHIMYAASLGYDNDALYQLSQKIINGTSNSGTFGEAYNLSYADIWDFSSKKQTLKKFEIELGVHHMELDFPWDETLVEEHWGKVVEYCVNDVVATEVTFEDRKQDFIARQILADLSGLTVNDTTQKHTAKIIFGNDRHPQKSFVYTNLAEHFPGYTYHMGKSSYRDEDPGEGGYVYAEPGIHHDVALLDVVSMHPRSIELLNLFGPYTQNYTDLKNARVAIKNGDYEAARKMLGGKLAPYLQDAKDAKQLSFALKIVINIVYGLTSAKFDNPFRDPRNIDNIVAKRGALFMIDLKNAAQQEGFSVAHIKTDSIKIPNATPEAIEFIKYYGSKYGYEFEHEATYDAFCLVNDAVYIAREGKLWNAVGAQFQHPYVFKTLFSGEEITFDDLCETKQVSKGTMYLDFTTAAKPAYAVEDLQLVGRTGRFVPVTDSSDLGGVLLRVNEDKKYAVAGTKGFLWMEAETAKLMGGDNVPVDTTYFEKLVEAAKKAIEQYGSFEEFINPN